PMSNPNAPEHATKPASNSGSEGQSGAPRDFIRTIVDADMKAGKNGGTVHTRFPPEPNGYLHIGHAKAICINFEVAAERGGLCNLRFDDTNPVKEDVEYVDAIKADIAWLGFDWGDRLYFASDYFGRLYELSEQLVEQGDAYVDSCTSDEIRELRGDTTVEGKAGPYRDRAPAESLDLLRRMRAGEFEDGAHVLRAKIDLASPNINLRDPIIYRIRHIDHHRTGSEWCIYPMYDWAHGLEDSLEGITHSLCSLEFENHRPLYDWFLTKLGVHHPQQIEFARLNLSFFVMSKRHITTLVEEGVVSGWDDPRLPTLRGLRRRGYTPGSIRAFCREIGVAKFNSTVELVKLENELRSELNTNAQRRLAVLDPVELVVTNWPEGKVDMVPAINNHEDESAGTREVPFSGRLYIERADFMEEPPKKFFRMAPGREVRLRYGYYVTCTGVEKDEATGEITRILCEYDPESRGGNTPDDRKVKATMHWVSAEHAGDVELRLYDNLFQVPNPMKFKKGKTMLDNLNPESLTVQRAKVEPSLMDAEPGFTCQFERTGYFTVDTVDSKSGAPVFNRAVSLRDSWSKVEKQAANQAAQRAQKK
ncbi:MAG: glutaminyl-tRNA synthetase, partial [Planctomycetota bacterium]